jgi:hypothetical protein
MSNYNYSINKNWGITQLAKKNIGAMPLDKLLAYKDKLEIDLSHNVYDKMTIALLHYVNSLLKEKFKVNHGGRRTRRNKRAKKSKKSMRRRR